MTAFFRKHGTAIAIVGLLAWGGALRYAWIVTAHP